MTLGNPFLIVLPIALCAVLGCAETASSAPAGLGGSGAGLGGSGGGAGGSGAGAGGSGGGAGAGGAGAAGGSGVGGEPGGELGGGGYPSGVGGFGWGSYRVCTLGLCLEDPELGASCQEEFDTCVARGHYARSCRMEADKTCGVFGETGPY